MTGTLLPLCGHLSTAQTEISHDLGEVVSADREDFSWVTRYSNLNLPGIPVRDRPAVGTRAMDEPAAYATPSLLPRYYRRTLSDRV